MKSRFQMYFANLAMSAAVFVILVAIAAAAQWLVFGQTGWRLVGQSTAISVVLVFFVFLPKVMADQERENLELREEHTALLAQFSGCTWRRDRANEFIGTFVSGRHVRDALKAAAGIYLAALRDAEKAARGQLDPGLPLDNLPNLDRSLSETIGKRTRAGVCEMRFEALRTLAGEHGFPGCPTLDDLLEELRSQARGVEVGC